MDFSCVREKNMFLFFLARIKMKMFLKRIFAFWFSRKSSLHQMFIVFFCLTKPCRCKRVVFLMRCRSSVFAFFEFFASSRTRYPTAITLQFEKLRFAALPFSQHSYLWYRSTKGPERPCRKEAAEKAKRPTPCFYVRTVRRSCEMQNRKGLMKRTESKGTAMQ